ncbi:MAG TPA: hypothetical protein VJ596_02840 [Gemmatimonadaceae bacterium]|nr:hypothetical protein [Gemmatimonadaceae bacterium]
MTQRMSEPHGDDVTAEGDGADRTRRLEVSLLSIASGVVVHFALASRLTGEQLVYAVVATVVLVGWVLRAFWTRDLRGRDRWRSLFWAVVGGITLATLYVWLSPMLIP